MDMFTSQFHVDNHLSSWRHDMQKLAASMIICEGNPPVSDEFPSQRVSNAGMNALFCVSLTKMLKKSLELLVISNTMTIM